MKKVYLILLSILTASLFIYSCEPPEDDYVEASTVFLDQALAEIKTLNNSIIIPDTFIEGGDSATNIIDISDFKTLNMIGFNTGALAPIDNTVSINASLESVFIIKDNGVQVPAFFESGETGGIIEEAGTEVTWREFLFNFTYPSNANPILIGNIDRIELIYTFEYIENITGESVYFKTFTHTIVFEN